MHSTTAVIVSLAACVAALPSNNNVWMAPTASDKRSPCPMLNSLANSGYINRNGLNISLTEFSDALLEVTNLDPAATKLVTAVGIKASTTGYADTLNLDDLIKHGIIEHDASLSRADWEDGKGDSHSFNKDIWAQTLTHFTTDTISAKQMAAARKGAIARANATHPDTFTYGAAQVQGSLLECALGLSVFGDATGDNANLKHLRVLFEEERLPFQEGWVKPAEVITSAKAQALAAKVLAATV
ncbi:chloroperoxidase [Apiospora saccharicola]|uniref:Chloroperoxidase n=1 Tax=Apiospora saccharicola TaxID=335842 RepID=A0ABR1UKR4_9PEZI